MFESYRRNKTERVVPEKRCQATAVHDAGWCTSVFWVYPVESRGGKSKKHRLDGLWAGHLKHGGTSSLMALNSYAMMPLRMELKNVFGGTTKISPFGGGWGCGALGAGYGLSEKVGWSVAVGDSMVPEKR